MSGMWCHSHTRQAQHCRMQLRSRCASMGIYPAGWKGSRILSSKVGRVRCFVRSTNARGARMRLPFMSRRRKSRTARDTRQDQHQCSQQEETEMVSKSDHPSFTLDDTRLVEEVLTEILYLACTTRPELRLPITNIAEGLANILSPDQVERCKDYVRFRVESNRE